jgi:hypothetical protein
VASVEILGCPGPTVPLGWWYVWYFGTRGLWYLWIFGSSDSSGTSGKQKSRFLRFASRLVLRIFLELYGTLVSVSAQLVMPLHDSDILTNIPFTSCNKQPITNGLTPVRPCNGSTLFLTARSDCWGCAFPHCAATVRPQSRRCSSLSVLLHRCGEGPLDDHCVPHSCKECGG